MEIWKTATGSPPHHSERAPVLSKRLRPPRRPWRRVAHWTPALECQTVGRTHECSGPRGFPQARRGL